MVSGIGCTNHVLHANLVMPFKISGGCGRCCKEHRVTTLYYQRVLVNKFNISNTQSSYPGFAGMFGQFFLGEHIGFKCPVYQVCATIAGHVFKCGIGLCHRWVLPIERSLFVLYAVPIVFVVKPKDASALGIDGCSGGGVPETIVGDFV